VFGPGGGVGKTTTALHLGHVLAMVRGDLAVALDANSHSGNLVKRVHEPHSPLGAGDLSRVAQSLSRCTDLTPYVTRAETGLWVVRSDPDAGSGLGATEYQHILQVLSTYASLLVIDLGTDMREQAFLAVAETADALVVVAPPEAEGVEAAVDALDGANERFPGQSRASVVVMNAARAQPRTPDIGELAAGSQLFADQVLYVPHDPHLATGGICRWDLLSRHTQDAYLHLTATVVTLLHEQEHPADELAPPQPGV
jgi:MinD-like ATPase involved in chromosome partitioning or flagellar assembly